MVIHAARNASQIRIDLCLLLVSMVASAAAAAPPELPAVAAPPKELGLDPFYTKYLSAHGLQVAVLGNVCGSLRIGHDSQPNLVPDHRVPDLWSMG